MNPQELLAALPAKAVAYVLTLLSDSYAQSEDPQNPRLPLVILHLRSGRDLLGRVVKLGSDPVRGQTLLVQAVDSDPPRSPEVNALYVPLDSIEAVTIRNADNYPDLLSEGALPAPPSTLPLPSRLEILRTAEEQAQALAKLSAITLKPEVEAESGLQGESLRSLSVIVKETFSVLSEIAADPLGKESLAAVSGVRIANGAAAGVRLADRRLEITAVLSKGRAGRLSRNDLKARISALL